MNVGANCFKIVIDNLVNCGYIAVTVELAVLVEMSGRKRHYFFAEFNEILRLARKSDRSILVITVIKRTDSYRIARCNKFMSRRIINYAGKLRVKLCKHICAVLFVHRQKNLAVAAAFKCIAL